jgi:hypothetical protein
VRLRELVHVHAHVEDVAGVEEIHAEGKVFVRPEGLQRIEADVAVHIVIELREKIRHLVGVWIAGGARHAFREGLDVAHVHLAPHRRLCRHSQKGGKAQKRTGENCPGRYAHSRLSAGRGMRSSMHPPHEYTHSAIFQ